MPAENFKKGKKTIERYRFGNWLHTNPRIPIIAPDYVVVINVNIISYQIILILKLYILYASVILTAPKEGCFIPTIPLYKLLVKLATTPLTK